MGSRQGCSCQYKFLSKAGRSLAEQQRIQQPGGKPCPGCPPVPMAASLVSDSALSPRILILRRCLQSVLQGWWSGESQ